MGATKRILILAFSFCLCIQLYAQQPVEKTLVKSFNLQGNDVVDLALEGDIQINEWNSNVIRVEMLITLQNGNEMLLKSLIKAGRYNLKSSETEDSFLISIPGLEREVKVKGMSLIDKVSYAISVPEGVNIREAKETTVQIEDKK